MRASARIEREHDAKFESAKNDTTLRDQVSSRPMWSARTREMKFHRYYRAWRTSNDEIPTEECHRNGHENHYTAPTQLGNISRFPAAIPLRAGRPRIRVFNFDRRDFPASPKWCLLESSIRRCALLRDQDFEIKSRDPLSPPSGCPPFSNVSFFAFIFFLF